VTKQVHFHRGVCQWGGRDNMSHPNSSLFRPVSVDERLAWLTTERATRDRFPASVKFFSYFVPWGVWARGVINPGYLVIEVLMQKTLVSSFSQGFYTYKSYEYLKRYTSKLMIYGFLNFFCVSWRRSSGKSGTKGLILITTHFKTSESSYSSVVTYIFWRYNRN
jgi:hypothetical protein